MALFPANPANPANQAIVTTLLAITFPIIICFYLCCKFEGTNINKTVNEIRGFYIVHAEGRFKFSRYSGFFSRFCYVKKRLHFTK